MEENRKLLEISHVSVGFGQNGKMNEVTHDVTLSVMEGEILGIVGESGSGKSVSMLAALGLLSRNGRILSGSVCYFGKEGQEEGIELNRLSPKQICEIRGKEISMIFQEPMTSLNPLMTIGRQVEEMLLLHTDIPKEERQEQVFSILKEAGLDEPEAICGKYPHQLSGGMRQRVMIAMAMILKPKLLIADEPTTALDVTIQAKILKLLKKFQQEYGTAIILISHDLGVIRSICSRAAVMCAGRIVEQGKVEELFENPREDYTKKLLFAALGKGKVIEHKNTAGSDLVAQAKDYSVFYQEKQFLKKEKQEVVKGVSFELYSGEIVGIVGESGCGKSTLAKAIAGLNTLTEGKLEIACEQPQMVFQDPYGSLNPAKTIGWLLTEPLRLHRVGTKEERVAAAKEMLQRVGLEEEYYYRYPSALSGGQRQRVAIAMAIMLKRKLILLDEPVSALDVTVQEQILVLLMQLQQEFGLTYLFISHDMNVIHRICDRVFVMYEGKIVESGRTEEIFAAPKHEYTKKLLAARL